MTEVLAPKTAPKAIRPRFFAAILRATEKGSIAALQLKSVAASLGCHPSLLTRYLKEAANAGWLRSEQKMWGVEFDILDRPALEAAAGLSRDEAPV